MNDRFKFRVWDKNHNEYIPSSMIGTLLYFGRRDEFHIEFKCFSTFADSLIIEQCTGLKDKNGNLIYEGDIIHEVDKEADIDDVSQIAWNQDTCHFMKLDLPDTKLNRHCLICEADSPYNEIIGNVHEQAEQKD